MGFYIGKQGTLYYQRENGSLSRFGVRVNQNGTLQVYDHLTREWYDVPCVMPDRSGGRITISITKEDRDNDDGADRVPSNAEAA
jgi:hypothetical protein